MAIATKDSECPDCQAHRATWKELFGDDPCCEGEKKRREGQTNRDKVISTITEVIYNNTDQNYKGAAIIAIGVWDRIKDYVEVK